MSRVCLLTQLTASGMMRVVCQCSSTAKEALTCLTFIYECFIKGEGFFSSFR